MIDRKFRFYALSGDIRIGGPSTWRITDWDQRRLLSVTMDEDQESEEEAIRHLQHLADDIEEDVYRIKLSSDGKLMATYTDSREDETFCPHYPALSECHFPSNISAVRRDGLEEIDRLGPDVDLVASPPCSGNVSRNLLVFKYYWNWQYAQTFWLELNLWMRLPDHPNLVSFDRVVLDGSDDRVVGFTTVFIPGDNLETNTSRTFKLNWLRQLIDLVDLLNLRYGIRHQDIARRNLLIDEANDTIKLFDFNYAARINPKIEVGQFSTSVSEVCNEHADDVKGLVFTMFEIITRDESFRKKAHAEQDLDALPQEWVQHLETRLDHPVADYQTLLRDWRKRRGNTYQSHVAPQAIEWPSMPRPPMRTSQLGTINGEPNYITVEADMVRRRELLAEGVRVLGWQRPPQKTLPPGTRLLATGATLHC